MALTLSGTNGVVGAGFTVDASGVSVTAGVGTFSSIGAGASVPAAGLTGALPTISAANCTNIPAANITGTLPAISGANLTGLTAGITEADQWRVTSDVSMGQYATNFTSNWERNDTEFEKIGTGMSVDSSTGHWTFPSTGKWLIMVHWQGQRSSGSNHFAHHYIFAMNDGNQSNGFEIASSSCGNGANDNRNTAFMQAIFDVTNVSTHKVLFGYYDTQSQNTTYKGSSSHNQNSYTFIKLGDT